MDFFDQYQGPDDLATGPASGVGDVAAAAMDSMRLIRNVGAMSDVYGRIYSDLNTKIKSTYNVDLPNPMSDWDRWDPESGWRKRRSVPRDFDAHIGRLRDWHGRQVAGLRAQNPELFDQMGLGVPVEDAATALMRRTRQTEEEVGARAGGATRLAGSLVGGMGGSFFDPLQVATLPAGGAGKTIVSRLVSSAVANAGIEAASYPLTMAQKERAGLQTGLADAAQDIAMAAAFGAGVQGASEAVVAGVRAMRRARAPVASPEARLDAAVRETPDIAAKAAGGDPAAERALVERAGLSERADVRGERGGMEADSAVIEARPAVIDAGDHVRAVNDTIRSIETGDARPAMPDHVPDGPAPVPDRLINPPGTREMYLGKPMESQRFDAFDLGFDADTFQYKTGGDARGVRADYAGVEQWDRLAAQAIMAYRFADGRLAVADGHQRTGMAQRLVNNKLEPEISLDAFVFNEADGWTAGQVRALAARRNLQQGTGDPIDTAIALREMPAILDKSVRRSTDHMRTALALSKLHPDVFRMVRAEVLPQNAGRAIGERVSDTGQQKAAADAVLRLGLKGEDTIAAFIEELKASALREDTTFDLFGEEQIQRSLAVEMADIKVRVGDLLKQNAKAFKRVNDAADMLEAKQNVIQRDVNAGVARTSGEAAQLLRTLSLDPGPLRDALMSGAGRLAAGEKPATVARDVANEIAALAEAAGPNGLLPRAPATSAGVKALAPKIDTPAGPDAARQADDLTRNLFGDDVPLPVDRPAEAATGGTSSQLMTANEILADFDAAMRAGHMDALRFDRPPSSEQLDDLIDAGRSWERAEIVKIFGQELAEKVMRLMRRGGDELDQLVSKFGTKAEQVVLGAPGGTIVDFDNLRTLRDTIVEIEIGVAEKNYDVLGRELSWVARNLPEFDKPIEQHSPSERSAVLVLSRLYDLSAQTGIDTDKILRSALHNTGRKLNGDVDDIKLVLRSLKQYDAAVRSDPVASTVPKAASEPDRSTPALLMHDVAVPVDRPAEAARGMDDAVPGFDDPDLFGAKAGGAPVTRGDVLAEVQRLDAEADLMSMCITGGVKK